MPNAPAHAACAAIVLGCAHARHEYVKQQPASFYPFLTAALASHVGSLPDRLEPATNPNHRQFFHGVVFAVGLGFAVKQLYEWEPQSDLQALLRYMGLVVGGAYLAHVLLDALTPKSVPLLGRL